MTGGLIRFRMPAQDVEQNEYPGKEDDRAEQHDEHGGQRHGFSEEIQVDVDAVLDALHDL